MFEELAAQMTHRRTSLNTCPKGPFKKCTLRQSLFVNEYSGRVRLVAQFPVRRFSITQQYGSDNAVRNRVQRLRVMRLRLFLILCSVARSTRAGAHVVRSPN